MRVLIIGGTGLISTAICAQLLARGDEVTLYNRGQREWRIPGQVRHIRGDRTRHATFERQMAEAGTFDIEDSATFPAYDRIIASCSRLAKDLAQEVLVVDA